MKDNRKVLEIKNLYMKYNKKDESYALSDLNFSIDENDFHAFIGENGAGKSTTIKIISGLNDDYDGEVFINGLNAKEDIKARESFSYIPDKIAFPSGIKTWDYLYNIALLSRNDKEKIKIELNELIDKYDIRNIINKNPNKLSSGQIKKILIIQTLLEKSKFVILDEPAAFLDPSSRLELFSSLKEMNKNGITIMISSHILEEIKHYVNSVTFIKKGKVVWTGKISGNELIKKYKEFIL